MHLAAALAVEAGSVARAVAMNASGPLNLPAEDQTENLNNQRPMIDESSSAEEDLDYDQMHLIQPDPEYKAACIV